MMVDRFRNGLSVFPYEVSQLMLLSKSQLMNVFHILVIPFRSYLGYNVCNAVYVLDAAVVKSRCQKCLTW